MRVLQLIDSLDTGGAERMAVNIANTLFENGIPSFFCATRKEGLLKTKLDEEIPFLFAKKQEKLDVRALLRVRKFIKKHAITHIHAHTTSFFFGVLLKLMYPKCKLIWHEHHGKRVTTKKSDNKGLVFFSRYFDAVITVNKELKTWSQKNLHCKEVVYIPNFVSKDSFLSEKNQFKKNHIVCVANLRPVKNHLNLLEAFYLVHKKYPDWELYLFGKSYNDAYEASCKEFISEKQLSKKVTFMGSINDVTSYLFEASIGVLSSDSEGLPMALLEYGASQLAVVTTDVGHCKEVIGDNGLVAKKNQSEALAAAILTYIENEDKRKNDATEFFNSVLKNYTDKSVIKKLVSLYS